MFKPKPTPQNGDGANVSASVGTQSIQPREEARNIAENPQSFSEKIAAAPMSVQTDTGAALSFSGQPDTRSILESVANGTDIPASDPWAARSAVDAPTLDGLTPLVASVIEELCRERQTPTEFYLAPIIAAVAAAAGSRVTVVAGGYTNKLNLPIVVIAPSGSNKSAPGREIMQPLEDINEQLRKRYEEELKAYQELAAAAAKSKTPINAQPPKKHCLIISNVTEESRKKALADNPHGVIQYNDELAAFFTNLGKYTRSNETGEIIAILDGNPVNDIRKTGEDVYIRHPYFSVFGTIQPGILLKHLATEDNYENGLASRFLLFQPTIIDISKKGSGNVEQPLNFWSEWIHRIYNLSGEWVLTLTDEAKPVYGKFWDESALIWNNSKSSAQKSVISKLKIAVLKLAGIAHLINEAAQFKEKTSALITADEMRWAASVCKYVYRKHMELIRQTDLSEEVRAADVVRMILRFNPDIKQTEIAQLLGLEPGTVRQIKYRMTPKK